jgi:hypothetical protein
MDTCELDRKQKHLHDAYTYLPEIKMVGGNAIKGWSLLLLYRLLESANRLLGSNFHRKHAIRII